MIMSLKLSKKRTKYVKNATQNIMINYIEIFHSFRFLFGDKLWFIYVSESFHSTQRKEKSQRRAENFSWPNDYLHFEMEHQHSLPVFGLEKDT